ncbi:tRNA (adenosine(37)-N6)-threonylcarbamoyltransferase complex dimerization subunit type 1 TsaB [Microbacterium sp. ZXX196]|uniref:tRNA (adenosine(37)-N6)-threonylcarbamoyltransferase complex dimerization subunit type 1 TsaB n=1 Tax=Microbacterium sp. ZXX196 TaxID=2609291 RepID=UPI0013260968|nr:tRNA (adenosine(37)-N6)-threonylcarbamoyltransferase complex dimerization subunit type 1 TsaB [Microbacterium sp. ZXX196]
MILAIDTSLGSGVAVVTTDGDVRGVAERAETRGHAEVIGDLILEALAASGAAPADITHVAAGMGPGPFTGLRIGIAAARAFAAGRGIDVVPVVSHDAVALDALEALEGPDLVVVTDARRREHAVSTYRGLDADGIPARVSGPALAPAAPSNPEPSTSEAVPGAARPLSNIAPGAPETAPGAARPVPALTTRIPAGALGVLAGRQLRAGRIPDLAEPLYLRAPDAKVPGAVKRVST